MRNGKPNQTTWGIEELLDRYTELRLWPSSSGKLRICGTLEFAAKSNGQPSVTDRYEVEITVPNAYPGDIPSVRETASRIPKDFHKLQNGDLCLGSPTRLRLILAQTPSLLSFIERCVIPYLYGYSIVEAGGSLPFGELSHGPQGLRDDLSALLGIKDEGKLLGFVCLISMKKRQANKLPCPCGSFLRVGRCHNRRLNLLRDSLGRRWFASLISRQT